MHDDEVGWTEEDDKRYWDEVVDHEKWWHEQIAYQFDRVRNGSGDALMDICHLRERCENEGIELVANGGFPERTLWEDDYVEKYSAVCDVVERTYQGMPLEHADEDAWKEGTVTNNDPLFHTSKESRAATMRIFEIFGIEQRDD